MLFRTFLRRFFSQQFLFALFVRFWKNYFPLFFPPFFWYDISAKKKAFSHFYPKIFFLTFFSRTIRFSGTIVTRVSFPQFFWYVIRANKKNALSHFIPTIFSPTFFGRTILVFLEKLFAAFFPPIFWSQ